MQSHVDVSVFSDIKWNAVSTQEFWPIADKIQEETLDQSIAMFNYLETATPEELRKILIQYRYFTVYYIPDLALLLARMPDGVLRSFLADILYDELGCGKSQLAHPQLYDAFLHTIGVNDINLDETALKNNIVLLDEARRRLVDPRRGYEYAIGLRGMGGECVCQVYIAQLHKCLIKNPYIQANKDKIDWRFWDLHVGDHDIEHREKTRAMIDTEIVAKGGAGLADLGIGYGYSMQSWKEFWVNIFALQNENAQSMRFERTRVRSCVDIQISSLGGCSTRSALRAH